MWSRAGWSRGPYSAGTGTEIPVPGHVEIPPPIPGGTTRYTYTATIGIPWSYRSWSGGGPSGLYPGGGISIAPNAERGVMRISAWWPDAPILQLVRLRADGTRLPVRGGYLTPTAPTRRNHATNPSLEIGLHGYVPGVGNPTLTRLSTQDGPIPAGMFALRATITEAGTCEVTVPHAVAGAAPTTIGVDLALSARPTSVTITVGWTDPSGTALAASVAELTADQVTASVHQWARQAVTVTPPAAAATTTTVKIAATGLPAAGWLDLDGVTIEPASTAGSRFDGDSPGATWVGLPGLSTSVLPPVLAVDDAEAPLDAPVSYLATNPALTGGRVVSAVAVLPSRGRTWLSHPHRAGQPIPVDLRTPPTVELGIDQGVFWVLGADRPVVVSGARRRAPAGTIEFNVVSWADRDRLQALLADAAPLLLRAPASYGYGDRMWLALGAVTEDREGRAAWQDAAVLSAEYVTVDPPAEP